MVGTASMFNSTYASRIVAKSVELDMAEIFCCCNFPTPTWSNFKVIMMREKPKSKVIEGNENATLKEPGTKI